MSGICPGNERRVTKTSINTQNKLKFKKIENDETQMQNATLDVQPTQHKSRDNKKEEVRWHPPETTEVNNQANAAIEKIRLDIIPRVKKRYQSR